MRSPTAKRRFRSLLILIPAILLFVFLMAKADTDARTGGEDAREDGSGYAERLFDASYVHLVNIQIAETDLADLRETPREKNKYPADVTIDGETFSQIAVSTKGSASLMAVAKNPDSQRYSLKLSFDKYREDQTYYGLEAIHLNNNVSDPSYLRDYISYSMFAEMGFPAPLASYVYVSVNGEPYGLFLALENIGEGFLNRTLDEDGELYKPEHSRSPGLESDTALGVDLVYTDNLPLSYNDIFDNAVTKVSGKDEKAVIKALKHLSQGNIEDSLYADLVCAYFAVHNFTLNSDSYLNTEKLVHNYYLYESDGLLAMLPWDYNNAYVLSDNINGAFLGRGMSSDAQAGSGGPPAGSSGRKPPAMVRQEDRCASYYINKGIDTPLMGESADRPMWSFIPENQIYLEKYHEYLDQLISEYYESGFFEEEFQRVYRMIRPYVDADVSRYYTMEEFEADVAKLETICTLRAQSIRKQLDGGLSCDSTTQRESDWIDASVLDA